MYDSSNQQTHNTPKKAYESNHSNSTPVHTTPQIQESKFLIFSPQEQQSHISRTGKKHHREGENVSITDNEPTQYRKTSSRLHRFKIDIKSPNVVEKLEFSSPPPAGARISSVADICHRAIQLRSYGEEDSNDAAIDTVIIRAKQEDSVLGTFCVWDEHWWVRRPLVEVNRYYLCILEDGLYSIELDIGPVQDLGAMDKICGKEKVTGNEPDNYLAEKEVTQQYTHVLVLPSHTGCSKSKVNQSFALHCTIPVREFASSRRVILSLRARDQLLLLRRRNPQEDNKEEDNFELGKRYVDDFSSLSTVGCSRQTRLLNENEDVDAVFPSMRLRKLND